MKKAFAVFLTILFTVCCLCSCTEKNANSTSSVSSSLSGEHNNPNENSVSYGDGGSSVSQSSSSVGESSSSYSDSSVSYNDGSSSHSSDSSDDAPDVSYPTVPPTQYGTADELLQKVELTELADDYEEGSEEQKKRASLRSVVSVLLSRLERGRGFADGNVRINWTKSQYYYYDYITQTTEYEFENLHGSISNSPELAAKMTVGGNDTTYFADARRAYEERGGTVFSYDMNGAAASLAWQAYSEIDLDNLEILVEYGDKLSTATVNYNTTVKYAEENGVLYLSAETEGSDGITVRIKTVLQDGFLVASHLVYDNLSSQYHFEQTAEVVKDISLVIPAVSEEKTEIPSWLEPSRHAFDENVFKDEGMTDVTQNQSAILNVYNTLVGYYGYGNLSIMQGMVQGAEFTSLFARGDINIKMSNAYSDIDIVIDKFSTDGYLIKQNVVEKIVGGVSVEQYFDGTNVYQTADGIKKKYADNYTKNAFFDIINSDLGYNVAMPLEIFATAYSAYNGGYSADGGYVEPDVNAMNGFTVKTKEIDAFYTLYLIKFSNGELVENEAGQKVDFEAYYVYGKSGKFCGASVTFNEASYYSGRVGDLISNTQKLSIFIGDYPVIMPKQTLLSEYAESERGEQPYLWW